ncbi:MAG: UDP-N-acetylmuramate--L-alanine ligase [Ruminococcaceae bacterium]|nr:UDP-N-acetylmuramate--L-alanine ligase [Oscillospiraceae bacterium]
MAVNNTHLGADGIARALKNKKSVYFLGIGGITMSSLAHVTHIHGFKVGGSDRTLSPLTERLANEGIEIFEGHKAEQIDGYDALVYTVAVSADTPELVRAKELGIPVISRSDYLGYIMRSYTHRVGLAGMHGKSTATSMTTEVFLAGGGDPTVISGAELSSMQGAYRIGGKENFVFESCEYMDSFLDFYPSIAVVLNIELDHVDYFKDLDHVKRSFRAYIEKTRGCGCAVLNADDENVMDMAKGFGGSILTFGVKNEADIMAKNISYENGVASFELCHGTMKKRVALSVSGEHNVYNALAAAACGILCGLKSDLIVKGLGNFRGASRRLELKGVLNGAKVYDDYAHHPTEIAATLRTVKQMGASRVICIYQPHTYSRTKGLYREFVEALKMADTPILSDIYAARETDTLGVSSEQLAKDIGENALYFDSFEKIAEYINSSAKEGDIILTMGAGNITNLSKLFNM